MTTTPPALAIPDRALVAGRWIAAFVGIVSSLPAAERADRSLAYASAWVVGIATWRTVRPFERLSQVQRRVWLCFEVGTTAVAVALSGAWVSPFTSSLIVVTVLAALSEDLAGAWLTIIAILLTVFAVGAVAHDENLVGGDLARLFTTIVVGALVGVTVRRGFSRLRNQAMSQTGELQRLADTNALMVRLTNLTRAGETIREPRDIAVEAATRFAVSFHADQTTVLQRGQPGQDWVILAQHHGSQSVSLTGGDRPSYSEVEINAVFGPMVNDPSGQAQTAVGDEGLLKRQRPTMTATLAMRNEVFGGVVVERESAPFTSEERRQLAAMCEVLSLSIDNSRWFRRLRSMGAEDERSRIARELHDRLGSSVAYSAFAFERLRQHYKDDRELAKAHDEARTTVGDLRDLLWQLRTGVTPASPLSVVGVDLARRFSNRTGIYTTFSVTAEARLPLPVEVELLRVTQEALNNVEKHAGATEVFITYEPATPFTRLTIVDNGAGFNPDEVPASESYGLSGIRERADAIGATVQISSVQISSVQVASAQISSLQVPSGVDAPTPGTTISLLLPTEEAFITRTGVEASGNAVENNDTGPHSEVVYRPANGALGPKNLHSPGGLSRLTHSGGAESELPIVRSSRSIDHEDPAISEPQ